MNVALLTAAGTGTRMHQDIPKQFMHVDDRPVIIHTLGRFQEHPAIDAVCVVTLESWMDVLSAYARQFGITKLRWVVPGGATGQESIMNGVAALARDCSDEDAVMVHDGNRCMVSPQVISDSLATFRDHGSAVAAIPCVEVAFRSKDPASSTETVPREELWRTQTPHTYTLGKLKWAHAEAGARGIEAAATCELMAALGERVWFSRGSEANLKITTVEDLDLFKALLHTERDGWVKRGDGR